MLALELEDLDAALAEANGRLETARHALALSADRTNALALRALVSEFTARGRRLDGALEVVVAETNGLRETLNRIHANGSAVPSHHQLDALGKLAILTALGRSLFHRSFEHLQPNQRHTFTELVEGSAASIKPSIRRRLGETKQKKDAA